MQYHRLNKHRIVSIFTYYNACEIFFLLWHTHFCAITKLILVNETKSSKYTCIWGILTLELSSYVLKIPNDAFTVLCQILISCFNTQSRVLQADWLRLENSGKATEL